MIKIRVSEKVRDRMKHALRRAGLREIGGIIMGQEIASGQFLVVDFSIDEISGERAHFVRDADYHRQALETFFDRTGHNYKEFNYLGEWHSHPSFSTQPSLTDLRSMQALVDGERGIEFAVLLIVKLSFFGRLITSAGLHRHGHEPAPVNLTTN
ncbi:Mov34/MPN/PAD-1 family protein [Pusillimonas sp. T7-7]|uniref:Mov34/MPN/PAD-1 family protein n=1 Tax=Pusillimonas sp. (strain T7-7) TaxID=1007105 RepID=UPI00192C574B|nr:Mov34/MPN/PAD-1 family protein [Pusillimonas sp. T7-7]